MPCASLVLASHHIEIRLTIPAFDRQNRDNPILLIHLVKNAPAIELNLEPIRILIAQSFSHRRIGIVQQEPDDLRRPPCRCSERFPNSFS